MGALRVVYLDHVAQLSGGELALGRMLGGLPDVQPLVILGEDGDLNHHLRSHGVPVEILPFGIAGDVRKDSLDTLGGWSGQLRQVARYVWALAERLRMLQPDLVHTNSLKSGYYGCLAARIAGVPVIWHLRDRLASDYLPRKAAMATRLMIHVCADGLICNSEATLATSGSGRSGIPRAVIPSPVVPSSGPGADRLPAPGTSQGMLTVAMVGRLAPWKGQDLFLRALATASAAVPACAVLVGSAMFGEDDYEAELRALVRELGLEDRVRFAGFIADVGAELDAADILVHASRTPEPFGQVIVEGMAAGLPVLAANAGGPAEVVTPEVNGLLFRPNDGDDLADKLGRLLRDPALRERLGAAGRAHAAGFGPAAIGEKVMELYRAVLAG